MGKIVRIVGPAPRIHYIAEWAERRGVRQAAVANAIGVDKSAVSKWFKGAMPSEKYLAKLAALFGEEEPASLFRHPDDDWIARFLLGRSEDERRRIMATLEAAFPRRAAGG